MGLQIPQWLSEIRRILWWIDSIPSSPINPNPNWYFINQLRAWSSSRWCFRVIRILGNSFSKVSTIRLSGLFYPRESSSLMCFACDTLLWISAYSCHNLQKRFASALETILSFVVTSLVFVILFSHMSLYTVVDRYLWQSFPMKLFPLYFYRLMLCFWSMGGNWSSGLCEFRCL